MEMSKNNRSNVVISGISGRFPQCDNIDELRDKLYANEDLIKDETPRWPLNLYGLTNRCGNINNLDKFDSKFFSIHNDHANLMDPQMRILIELAYEAIIDSGINPESLRGSNTAVIIGANISECGEAFNGTDELPGSVLMGTNLSLFANRISFAYDLKGPSYFICTACSTTAIAINQAVELIYNGQCDSALVGGAQICLSPLYAKLYSELNILSPDGKCKFLDEKANGFVRSESCSMIFLQRSHLAKRIYAHIIQCSVNNDGYKVKGLTNPSSDAQTLVMRETLLKANLSPDSVTYIEAHGTGTRVGDRAEVNAVHKAYCEPGYRDKPLLIGSVKTNLGHTEAASALVSIAKVAIMFENKMIPASLHLERLNSYFENIIPDSIKPVSKNTNFEKGIVGINSWGIGGTNAHILLEPNEYCSKANDFETTDLPRLVPFFGRTKEAVEFIMDFFKNHPDRITNDFLSLYTQIAQNVRSMNYRSYIMVKNIVDFNYSSKSCKINNVNDKKEVCFLFSGMGSQWLGMGKEIINITTIKESLDKSSEILKELELDLYKILFDEKHNLIENSTAAHVAIISIQIALVDLLKHLEIKPDYFIGHSLGEIMCAYADGCLDHKQTLLNAYWRSNFETFKNIKVEQGSMAVVGLSWQDLKNQCPDNIVPACHNSNNINVISGEAKSMKKYLGELVDRNIFVKEFDSCGIAYHSHLLNPFKDIGIAKLKEIISEPKLRSSKWISTCVTDQTLIWNKYSNSYASAEYFLYNMLSPVLFYEALQRLPSNTIVIELGPHCLLQTHIKSTLGSDISYIPVMKRNNSSGNVSMILSAVGQLYSLGLNPDISKLYPRVSYPVSRGTQSISPLIKWDHSIDWFVPLYPKYFNPNTSRNNNVTIDYNNEEDKIYFDHCINGEIVFPTTAYIIMIWKMIAKAINRLYTEIPIEIENLMIHKSIILNKDEITTFTINRLETTGEFTITSNGEIIVTGKALIMKSNDFNNKLYENFNYDKRHIILKPTHFRKELKLRGYNFVELNKYIKEISDDGTFAKIQFNQSLYVYLSTVFNVIILNCKSRDLQALVSIESFKCDPKFVFNKFGIDHDVNVFFTPKEKILISKGVLAKGITAATFDKQASKQKPILATYKYSEFKEKIHIKNQQEKLFKNLMKDETKHFDQKFKSDLGFVYKKHLIFNDIMTKLEKYDLKKALEQINEFVQTIFESDVVTKNILPKLMDLIVENSKDLKVLLLNENNLNLFEIIKAILDNSNIKFKINEKQWSLFDKYYDNEQSSLIIYQDIVFTNEVKRLKIENLIDLLHSVTMENGFILLLLRKSLTPIEIILSKIFNLNLNLYNTSYLYQWAFLVGLSLISEKQISNRFTFLLFRKITKITIDKPIIIETSTWAMDWLPRLKSALKENENVDSKIWLTAKNLEPSGLIGLMNCLKCEPKGDRVKCIIHDKRSSLNQNNHVFINEMLVNVVHNGQIGSYHHENSNDLFENNLVESNTSLMTITKTNQMPMIDWYNNNNNKCKKTNCINVYYATLNMSDQKLYTSKTIPIFSRGDTLFSNRTFGHEFSGCDSNGNPLMGIAKNSVSTVVEKEICLSWPIPDGWSLEEACTVPYAYCMAYYALGAKAKIEHGQIILINSKSLDITMAFISVCLELSCQFYIIIYDELDMNYIKEKYRNISKDHFINQKYFDHFLINHSISSKIDVIVNYFGDKSLNKCITLIKNNGVILNIGNEYLSQKYKQKFDNNYATKNITYHGIVLDDLINDKKNRKNLLKSLSKGIEIGMVTPFRYTIYLNNQIKEAFENISSNKHHDKIIIQLREAKFDNHIIPRHINFKSIQTTIVNSIKSYIIVGGLGGFGLELAFWLIKRNCRYLVLNSRSGFKDNYLLSSILRIRCFGVRVIIIKNNLADYNNTKDCSRISSCLGEIGGFFNLAMIISDGLFENQTISSFNLVTEPKLIVTRNMDILTRTMGISLDYFVVFSSVSACHGFRGQTNYGFANSAMERVCESRRRDGLHGLAIQWGPIGDIGFWSDVRREDQNETHGYGFQELQSCLDFLDRVLNKNYSVVCSHLKAEKEKDDIDSDKISENNIVKIFSKIFNIKNYKILPKVTTMAELGMDSLMAVELKQSLEDCGHYPLLDKDLFQITIGDILFLK